MEQVLVADFRVGAWRVQPSLNRLARGGETVQVEPKVMQVLVCLAGHAGEVVSRDRLLDEVWTGTIVHDDVLSRSVSELRKVFGDDPRTPAYIETIRKSGYRLIAPVSALVPAPGDAAAGDAAGDGLPAVSIPFPAPPPAAARRMRRAAWLLPLLALGGLGLWLAFYRPPAPPRPLRALPLTTYPGNEVDPAFSPDGDRIAFAWEGTDGADYDVYAKVVGAETPLRLTTDPADDRWPAWSPDGRFVAFVRASDTACALLVVPATGGSERRLSSCAPDGYVRPVWLPGGGEIVFADRERPDAPYRLTFLSVASGARRYPLAPAPGTGGDVMPALSPDGRQLAFARFDADHGARLYVAPVAGGTPRRLSDEVLRKLIDLEWMPGGDALVFSAYREGRLSLWQLPAGGGAVHWLPVGSDDVVEVAVSPARRQLAYRREDSDDNIWRLPLGAPGAAPARVIASTRWDSKPRYAPDGRRIAFQSMRSGQHEIWVCDADGANPLPLTAFGVPFTRDPSWSPDSRHVAFSSSVEGYVDVYVVDAAGGAPRRVTDDPGAEHDPQWSPDGRWLYFRSDRGGAWDVWRMPAAGGAAAPVTRDGSVAAFAPAAGDALYYTRYDEAGLWRLDPGAAPRLVADGVRPPHLRNWLLTPEGVYYAYTEGPGRVDLRFHRFTPAATATLASVPGLSSWSGLSRSPDGATLLFARTDHSESDLVLVEGW